MILVGPGGLSGRATRRLGLSRPAPRDKLQAADPTTQVPVLLSPALRRARREFAGLRALSIDSADRHIRGQPIGRRWPASDVDRAGPVNPLLWVAVGELPLCVLLRCCGRRYLRGFAMSQSKARSMSRRRARSAPCPYRLYAVPRPSCQGPSGATSSRRVAGV